MFYDIIASFNAFACESLEKVNVVEFRGSQRFVFTFFC